MKPSARIPSMSPKKKAEYEAKGITPRSTIQPKPAKRGATRTAVINRTPIKKVNAKRQKKERLRANGDEAYKTWLHDQPCAVCKWQGNTVLAHAKTGGASRKADAKYTLPMCCDHVESTGPRRAVIVEGCHERSHRVGVKTFEHARGITLLGLAAEHQQRYADFVGGSSTGRENAK